MAASLLIYVDPSIPDRACAEYCLGQLLQMAGFRHGSGKRPHILISYGDPSPDEPVSDAVVRIRRNEKPPGPGRVRRTERMKGGPETCDFLFGAPLVNRNIPALYETEEAGSSYVAVNGYELDCGIDLVRTAGYFFTLQSERDASGVRDTYGRFDPGKHPLGSAMFKHPVLDVLIDLFASLIQQAGSALGMPVETVPRWPGGRDFALGLTHDVDRLRSWTAAKALRALRSQGPLAILTVPFSALMPSNWSGNFAAIEDLESRYHAGSTYFFIGRKRSNRDPVYDIRGERLRKGFAHVEEAGVHGTITSARTSGALQEERIDVESVDHKAVHGVRFHYLTFDPERTLAIVEEAGLEYDSTLGFASQIGWRCGTSLPFRPWDGNAGRPLRIWELPMGLMDTTLFHKLKKSGRRAWDLVEPVLEETLKNGGCLVLNWHNNNIHPLDPTGYTGLYHRILDWAQEHNGWITGTNRLMYHWSSRSRLFQTERG